MSKRPRKKRRVASRSPQGKQMNSMKKMTALELIGLVASLGSIIGFAMWGIPIINGWIDSLRPPTTLTFYFLVFWALVAATLGAALWYLLNILLHLIKPTFGDDSEPHGIAVCVWSLATNVPAVLILVIINWSYRFASIPYQLLLYGTFLVGITIGSLIFYDFPLWGNKGFREYFKQRSYYSREFWLVVLWSLLISGLGFLAMGLVKFIAVGVSDFVTPIRQIGFCVILTTSAVAFYIVFFPDEPKFGQARGIVAGLVLRMTLFFGLILGTGPVNVHWVLT